MLDDRAILALKSVLDAFFDPSTAKLQVAIRTNPKGDLEATGITSVQEVALAEAQAVLGEIASGRHD